MQINIKELRNFRLQYQEDKGELTATCQKIIEYAAFLGCQQAPGKEDVRVSLGFIEGFLSALEHQRSNK